MDEESRKLIEQMLAEEEFYYGSNSLSDTTPTKKKKMGSVKSFDQTPPKKENNNISSASLPSHKTRWTEEEDKLLKEALDTIGYGNWKSISKYVKTRNPLQCKNHARHLTLSDKVVHSTSSGEIILNQHMEENEVDETNSVTLSEDISVEDDKDNGLISSDDNTTTTTTTTTTTITTITATVNEENDNTTVKTEKQDDTSDMEITHDKIQSHITNDTKEPSPENDLSSPPQEDELEAPTSEKEIPHQVDISPFDRFNIAEEEIAQNPEWFKQKYSKTPERYLRIRNHMLDCWHHCKPRYLTKTSARKGLKDCGDVNAIGRVHEYLESIGAINVDCTTSAPRPPRRIPRETYEDAVLFDAAELVVEYDGPRKRKVRNEHGDWVDPRELEGRVIEHGQIVELDNPRPKRMIKKQHSHQYYGGDDFSRGYDPFRLVPTTRYDDDVPAPFDVEINSDCLLIMDFHSHLAHTEIIGLLGGSFIDNQQGSKVLQVKTVFPCQSTSTGIQCEMDPVSEMKAREVFQEKGYRVVGWYHSHPTFEPHPSIRDIENQTSYQTLFKDDKTGDEPFIGSIITPYDPNIISEHSQIQYIHISKTWNETQSYRIPYACRRRVNQNEQVSCGTRNQIKELIDEYKNYEHKMDMTQLFGSQTRLEKLLDSLRAHLFLDIQDEKQFLDQVKELMLSDFIDKKETEELKEEQK
ncbi:hypothetical protein K501DRAFT_291776 [Backusella circina FSU 941]|nr:hypothetical protein K501DRAFT_291776 [Backusella circina FSU 941]